MKACSRCGATPARPYMNHWLCDDCAPPPPEPDPASTAAGLRDRRARLLRLRYFAAFA